MTVEAVLAKAGMSKRKVRIEPNGKPVIDCQLRFSDCIITQTAVRRIGWQLPAKRERKTQIEKKMIQSSFWTGDARDVGLEEINTSVCS
jgi:hypothetical protein